MALADILQVIVSQKESEMLEIKESQERESKKLLEEAEEKGIQYSAKRFDEFEQFKVSKERSSDSDVSREKRIKLSQLHEATIDSIFSEVEKKLSTLSKEELTALCSRLLRSIPEESGSIISKGTDIDVLKKSLVSAEKKFEVVEEKGDGGFEFKGDGYTVDFSFHTLVQKDLRDKYEADLFQELF